MTYMPPASPVNLDASITSLSAGSLTTVARADHVHTLSSTPVLLISTILSSAIATVSIVSIPSQYSNLRIEISARSSYTSGGIDFGIMQFNGDTAANYGQSTAAGSWITVLRPPPTTNYLTAGWASGIVSIWDYSSTSKFKAVSYNTTYNNSTTAFNAANYQDDAAWWKSTAAVTSIQYKLTSGANYVVGSTFRVWGYP